MYMYKSVKKQLLCCTYSSSSSVPLSLATKSESSVVERGEMLEGQRERKREGGEGERERERESERERERETERERLTIL